MWGIGGRVRCFVFAWLGMLGRLHFFFQPRLGENSQDRGSRIFLGFAKLRKEGRLYHFYLSYFILVGLHGCPAMPMRACSGFLDPMCHMQASEGLSVGEKAGHKSSTRQEAAS